MAVYRMQAILDMYLNSRCNRREQHQGQLLDRTDQLKNIDRPGNTPRTDEPIAADIPRRLEAPSMPHDAEENGSEGEVRAGPFFQ
jgi:hypothetical protein